MLWLSDSGYHPRVIYIYIYIYIPSKIITNVDPPHTTHVVDFPISMTQDSQNCCLSNFFCCLLFLVLQAGSKKRKKVKTKKKGKGKPKPKAEEAPPGNSACWQFCSLRCSHNRHPHREWRQEGSGWQNRDHDGIYDVPIICFYPFEDCSAGLLSPMLTHRARLQQMKKAPIKWRTRLWSTCLVWLQKQKTRRWQVGEFIEILRLLQRLVFFQTFWGGWYGIRARLD